MFHPKQADIKEITIQLPPMLVSKYADSPASRLRSIREQCEGIQLQTKRLQPRQLTISGPPAALEKAKSLIESMCAKLAERCADVCYISNHIVKYLIRSVYRKKLI